jgi:predicted RNA binding protein YcfA (HicA-like mRNA interferase family)
MKIPRDIKGDELVKALKRLGFVVSRQTGSHIRMSVKTNDIDFHITIPNHSPIKIGTLNAILNEISTNININKQEIIDLL